MVSELPLPPCGGGGGSAGQSEIAVKQPEIQNIEHSQIRLQDSDFCECEPDNQLTSSDSCNVNINKKGTVGSGWQDKKIMSCHSSNLGEFFCKGDVGDFGSVLLSVILICNIACDTCLLGVYPR